MNSSKLKQFALGLCVVLSLFASSVAACGCSHHRENAKADAPSCHQDSAHQEMPMSPLNSAAFEQTDCCVCVQAAPRAYAKSEIVKIEKQAIAAIAPRVSVSTQTIAVVPTIESVYFPKPLYLSDPFYKIKSPRAPPRL